MISENKKNIKSNLHPRNRNRNDYDVESLINLVPELKKFISLNKFGVDSIDFSNPKAVKLLNQALLKQNYDLEFWDFPAENLCPPIPGRADYIHYVADLLAENNSNKVPKGSKITCLDVGTGASCIYPIIGISEYGWNFIATDIDENSIQSAQNIIEKNPLLNDKIELRLQKNAHHIFTRIINEKDKIDVSISNPPFHESREAAEKSNRRKTANLSSKTFKDLKLNFSGKRDELIYAGGEIQFIENMIRESILYSKNIFWFTTLVSKQSNLKKIYTLLHKAFVSEIRTIEMGTGNKSTRIVTWTFLSKEEKSNWRK